jgi:hypothetical protein
MLRPKGKSAPPWWIRGLLIFTSAGVSFAHGSNDGQKGMGLIMLILIGTVPTAYALNRTLPAAYVPSFVQNSLAASKVVEAKAAGYDVLGDPRPAVTNYLTAHHLDEGTYPSLAVLMRNIANDVQTYGTLAKIPAGQVGNTRNDMYLASEAIRFLQKDKAAELSTQDIATLAAYKKSLDNATKFIPDWVKFSVALALGLGTMIGWKRIVINRRRKDRQAASDLWAGRRRRDRRDGDDRSGRQFWLAGLDDPCSVVRRRGHDGGQWVRRTNVDHPQHRARLGVDPALRDGSVGVPLLCIPPPVLGRPVDNHILTTTILTANIIAAKLAPVLSRPFVMLRNALVRQKKLQLGAP